jgi:ribosylpyrimidine nucleosidase
MRFTLKSKKIAFGLDGGHVHDVTYISYLVAPELFTTQDMNVVVDINSGPRYGGTICYTINCLKQPTNCTVGTGINLPRFWDLVAEAVALYN